MNCPYGIGAVVRAGERPERYRLLARLGEGASAFVFEAHDLRRGGRVALKLLRSRVAAMEMQRECAALQALSHASIIPLLSFGFTRDELAIPYIAVPLLRGALLRVLINDHHAVLTLDRTLPWAADLFRALAHAHAHGVLHRDVRPENIFLVREVPLVHPLVLFDFGLSESVMVRHGAPARPIADRRYAAPELFYEHPPSPASDTYAAGIVLFELLTGAHPLGVPSGHWAYNHFLTAPPPLDALLPDAPAALVELQAALLAKSRGERPSAAESADAITAISRKLALPNCTAEDDVDSILRHYAGPTSEEDTDVGGPPSVLLRNSRQPDDTDECSPPSSCNVPVSR